MYTESCLSSEIVNEVMGVFNAIMNVFISFNSLQTLRRQ